MRIDPARVIGIRHRYTQTMRRHDARRRPEEHPREAAEYLYRLGFDGDPTIECWNRFEKATLIDEAKPASFAIEFGSADQDMSGVRYGTRALAKALRRTGRGSA